ncbi:DUF4118 domain-containing protein [Streptomyces sp. NPDC050529]|uniref:DUF4118 domain-containing protein n=1 Tax=Streptomyces sp. NPDC050529 TaxID=3365624 RepID=UPI0037B003F9
MSGISLRDRAALAAALVCPLAVAGILVPFRTHLTSTNGALILVVVVVAIAAVGNRAAGLLAALSAAVWFDFFLTAPYQRFAIDDGDDIQTAVLLLVVGLIVSQLAAHARRLQVIAITDADHLATIRATAQLARSATSPDAVVEHVRGELIRLLDLQGCRFEYGTLLGRPPRLEQNGDVVAGRRTWDSARRGQPQEEIELRATGNGHYYGRFMLLPPAGTEPAPLQARLVAVTLANLTGTTLATIGAKDSS